LGVATIAAEAGCGHAGRVTAERRQLDIDVSVDGDQITGWVADGAGGCRPFSGWLGLILALEKALEPPERTAAGTRGDGRSDT
jgi:hypothetical protein